MARPIRETPVLKGGGRFQLRMAKADGRPHE